MVHIHHYFFFTETPPTKTYTLSLHDALPISSGGNQGGALRERGARLRPEHRPGGLGTASQPSSHCGEVCPRLSREPARSEEHTSELQSRPHLVCRLLLEKKKKKINSNLQFE